MKNDFIDAQLLAQQLEKQNETLNHVMGYVPFTLALVCLGLPNPDLIAFLCSPVILINAYTALKTYPSELAAARSLEAETKDKELGQLIKRVSKMHYGVKDLLIKTPMYCYGMTSYFLVLLVPQFGDWVKAT